MEKNAHAIRFMNVTAFRLVEYLQAVRCISLSTVEEDSDVRCFQR